MSVNNISFILHKPQLSENIGACARGMKNFNFNKLIVIDPKPIFPNDKILATSVGAKNIINKAKNFENLEKPLKNIDIVIATSARFRNKNIKHIQLEDLKKISFKKSNKVKSASKKEIVAMANLCIQNLEEINFFKSKEKKPIMLENLRNIFYRMELSTKETRILSGVFASLGKKR